jgi:serine protease DegQ
MAETLWTKLSNEIAGTVDEAGKSVVALVGRGHPLSGVIFRRDAIMTVHHALRRDDEVLVITGPGQKTKARVVGRDPGTDLAVLRLEQPLDGSEPKWGRADNSRVGEWVLALGRTWRGNVVASGGVLSGVMAGPWKTWRGGELEQFIRPDLRLYPGFSGGPLLAGNGQFLGINTSGLHRSGIAIPASTVARVGTELLDKGHLERPYLGLGMQPVALPESLRSKLNLNASEGLLVAHLELGGPAEKANIMLGDVVLELGGRPVADTGSVQDVLRAAKAGQKIEASLIRAGALISATILLEARPVR